MAKTNRKSLKGSAASYFAAIEADETPVTVEEAVTTEPEDETPVTVETASVSEPIPAAPVPTPRFVTLGVRDVFGFGSDTETSFLLRSIRTGTFTRSTLLTAFLARFVPTADATETKKKKISFSVFLSDVRRPIGTYHASRSLSIISEEGTGVLSFTSDSVSLSEAAIAGGILSELKGLSPKRTPEKYRAVLTRFGLPVE